MDQLSAEKRLSLAYLLVIAAGAASSISTGVAWSHWYRTLDQCVGRNCSCIIYGTHTMQYFLGGGQAPCIWVTFGPLIYLFFTIGLICFHGYRVLFTTKSPSGRSTRTMLAKLELLSLKNYEIVDHVLLCPKFTGGTRLKFTTYRGISMLQRRVLAANTKTGVVKIEHNDCNQRSSRKDIKLLWVPSHLGISGKEKKTQLYRNERKIIGRYFFYTQNTHRKIPW
ncbi:uncharacterized protein LOC130440856 isoform X2 [Diorhabda sublineata]|uniref:uncharacterized protein LOC130440856 isoform X2 n=1 Tax=Diorhabda sublineata TaxID=1163346 RepID=UPI0024E173A1|nr:uncharacterized protein LOC130440856 isoform X2 [Diorhabda sublineata]